MRSRYLIPILAASLLGASPLMAQQATDQQFRKATDEQLIVPAFNLTVDQIDDMDVVGANGERLGEVEEVLVNASGQPVAITVEVGGFLGIGSREVIMRMDQVRREGDRFIAGMTKEQIEALPRWTD